MENEIKQPSPEEIAEQKFIAEQAEKMAALQIEKDKLLSELDPEKEEVVVVDVNGQPTAQVRKLSKEEIESRKKITPPEVVEAIEPEMPISEKSLQRIQEIQILVLSGKASQKDLSDLDALWKIKQLTQ